MFKHLKSAILFPAAVLLLSPPAFAASAGTVATVDGHAISSAQLRQLERLRGKQSVDAGQRKVLVQALIDRQLLADAAVKLKLDRTPATQALIANARTSILARAALRKYVAAHPITDKEMRALYDKDIARLPKTQYRVRAVVTRTRKQAQAVVAQLAGGADFAHLAAKNSLLSHKQAPGGRLGWRFATNFLPPVTAAIETGAKGKPSAPVWTPKGWWVVVVDGKRDTPHKSFKKARAGLHGALMQQRVQAYLKTLRKTASISGGRS